MSYDLITVGGGMAGASLALQMAQRGYRVLVLERETQFRDRVRGEQMYPWGIVEARTLGIYDELLRAGGRHARWLLDYRDGTEVGRRDLTQSTHRVGFLHFYHPTMQETLLGLAEEAGAEVQRGTWVENVIPGKPPVVQFRRKERLPQTVAARLVVGADGRNSQVRSWGSFTVRHEPDRLVMAGIVLENLDAPEDAWHRTFAPNFGVSFLPQGNGRARAYVIRRKAEVDVPFSGSAHIPNFLALCRAAKVLPEWLARAEPAGPLAEFNCADHWVDHPARAGIVLIGDAAAASDPFHGCGTSLSLMDVRYLRDCLLASDDWESAADRYAEQHDEYYGVIHRLNRWRRELTWATGPDADVRRTRFAERVKAEPARNPDIIGLGPANRSDESVRRFMLEE